MAAAKVRFSGIIGIMQRVWGMLTVAWVALAGCSDSTEPLTEDESRTVFVESNRALHAMHLEAFADDESRPTTYVYDCAESGTISMEPIFDEDDTEFFFGLRSLLHRFDECTIDGTVINGDVDYVDFEDGSCGRSVGFDIVGEVSVGGLIIGGCVMAAREDCGVFSGLACGFDAGELIAGLEEGE